MRQYTRNDVDFATFYTSWMKSLALHYTLSDLQRMRDGAQADAKSAGLAHLRAIERTSSMTSNSSARAHARNVVSAAGESRIALEGAIEIHELFPEFGKPEEKRRKGGAA